MLRVKAQSEGCWRAWIRCRLIMGVQEDGDVQVGLYGIGDAVSDGDRRNLAGRVEFILGEQAQRF